MTASPAVTPTLVLLPGLHGTRELFRPLLEQVPASVPIRLVDYPADKPQTRKELLARVTSELADLPGMILLAESFSGPIAIEFAAANPDRVKALILCVTFVQPPVPRVLCYLATIPVLLRCPLPTLGIRMFLSGFRAPWAVVRELRREVNRIRPWTLAHRIRQAAWIDTREALARCGMPILCLAGKRDRLVGPRSIRRIRRVRADIPIHMLDGPHVLLQTKPAECWAVISPFLETKVGCQFHTAVSPVSSDASLT
jgi:pimeloyl-ACP methyl ester carboxylesterase